LARAAEFALAHVDTKYRCLTACTGDGKDTLTGNSAGKALDSGRGNDAISGGAVNDILTGGSGGGNVSDAGTMSVTLGLRLWLGASDAAMLSDGTDVSQWRNKSGLGHDAFQAASGVQPDYDAMGFGGLGAVSFEGNDYFELATQHLPRGFELLPGEAGDDTTSGGAGDDLFVFSQGDDADSISDFAAGSGTDDALDISAFNFADFDAVQAATTTTGTDSIIQLDADDSITLLGVKSNELHEDDFLI